MTGLDTGHGVGPARTNAVRLSGKAVRFRRRSFEGHDWQTYWEGMDAYLDGLDLEDNPYIREKEPGKWIDWRKGWMGY